MTTIKSLQQFDGFLYMKRKQTSKNWKKYWFVLNGTTLTYYNNFIKYNKIIDDSSNNNGKNDNDIELKNCYYQRYIDGTKGRYAFIISYRTTNKILPYFLYTDNEDTCNAWLIAIKNATEEWDISKSCHILNINQLELLQLNELDIINAYRIKCREYNCHNSNSNSSSNSKMIFKRLQRAFRHISYYIKNPILYNIKRNVFNVRIECNYNGLGLHIGEINDKVVVIDILDHFNAESIIPLTESLHIGDQLIEIDEVDITNMPFQRILDMLSSRVTSVDITFSHLDNKQQRVAAVNTQEVTVNNRIKSKEIQSIEPFTMVNAFTGGNPESETDDTFNVSLDRPISREKLGWYHFYRLMKLNSKEGDVSLILDNMSRFVNSCPPNDKFELPIDIDNYIESVQLPIKVENTPAFQKAVYNASSIDKSGLVLKKWELSGDSAADKLARFESKLNSRTSSKLLSTNRAPISIGPSLNSPIESVKKKRASLKDLIQRKGSLTEVNKIQTQTTLKLQSLKNVRK